MAPEAIEAEEDDEADDGDDPFGHKKRKRRKESEAQMAVRKSRSLRHAMLATGILQGTMCMEFSLECLFAPPCASHTGPS